MYKSSGAVCIRCCGNVVSEPLTSSGHLFWFHYLGFQALGGYTDTACYLLHAGFLLGLFFGRCEMPVYDTITYEVFLMSWLICNHLSGLCVRACAPFKSILRWFRVAFILMLLFVYSVKLLVWRILFYTCVKVGLIF
jgi:hypothetical protein